MKRCGMLAMLLLMFASVGAHADSKALVIGIGEYPRLDRRLPGIEVDVENLRVTAARIGVDPANITILENADASLARMQAALNAWLSVGVDEDDVVLVLLSALGTNDHGTPALVAYDSTWSSDGGLQGTLPLEELVATLQALPSERIYVVLDVGFLGSGEQSVVLDSKSIGVAEAVSKFIHAAGSSETAGLDLDSRNVVVLGSEEPNVFATEHGSMISLAVRNAMDAALVEHEAIDIDWLRDRAQVYLDDKLGVRQRCHFAVAGDARLLESPLPVTLDEGNGPEWNFYLDLAKSGTPLELDGGNLLKVVEDELTIRLDAPIDGYLNIISVDAADQAVALFPNKFHRNNRIEKGTFRLPTEAMSFAIQAQPPLGPTLVVALLTTAPINAYELTTGNRNRSGIVQDVFASLAGNATRAFRVVGTTATPASAPSVDSPEAVHLYGGALEFLIQEKRGGLNADAASMPADSLGS